MGRIKKSKEWGIGISGRVQITCFRLGDGTLHRPGAPPLSGRQANWNIIKKAYGTVKMVQPLSVRRTQKNGGGGAISIERMARLE